MLKTEGAKQDIDTESKREKNQGWRLLCTNHNWYHCGDRPVFLSQISRDHARFKEPPRNGRRTGQVGSTTQQGTEVGRFGSNGKAGLSHPFICCGHGWPFKLATPQCIQLENLALPHRKYLDIVYIQKPRGCAECVVLKRTRSG